MTVDSKGRELFIVDNSVSGWTGLRYLEEWSGIAKAFDIATGYFEIGALLALDGKWQPLDKIRILMGAETTHRTRKALLDAVRARALQTLDGSIEADNGANPFLHGVPAILEALRSGQIECRVYDKDKFHANPFLRELMETFLKVGGRRGKAGGQGENHGIDFDELGVSEVVELLDEANMEAVVRDFGDRNPQEDPVILVLPNPCRLLSRELLYTALTRQKNRVVILHQGPRTELRRFSSGDRSETARRLTNLFLAPSPIEVDGRFFEEHLIHRTARGEMVRSKSEVIIANALAAKGVDYAYERPLTLDGVTKYPDFTIEDMESGQTLYWEHCGMLHVPSYRRRWEEKLEWYQRHGIRGHEDGGGAEGALVVTRYEANGSIDSAKIARIINDVLG